MSAAVPTMQIAVAEYANVEYHIQRVQRLVELASTTLVNSHLGDDQSTVIDLLDVVVEQVTKALHTSSSPAA
jgi:hypothetical protein